jgi:predicted permease
LVFRLNLAEQGLFGMSAIFGNTVLAGIPIVYAAFGEAGLVPLLLIIIFHPTMIFPVVTLIIEASLGKGDGMWATVRATIRSLATNPVIVALLVGVAWNGAGFSIPDAADSFLKLLAGAAAPAALFALGATLTRFKLASGVAENVAIATIKLAILPTVMWLALTTFTALPPLWVSVAVLTAALPTGANVFLMAQRYDVYVARSSTVVLASTATSALTLSAVLIWLGV